MNPRGGTELQVELLHKYADKNLLDKDGNEQESIGIDFITKNVSQSDWAVLLLESLKRIGLSGKLLCLLKKSDFRYRMIGNNPKLSF